MATEMIKANVMKMKPNEDGSSSKGKAIVTKSSKQVIDSNQKSNVTVTKSEAKEKSMASSSKTVSTTTAVKVKSQRKVYTLPGQKHDPPEEREPLRIFYESLLNQIPSSQMAEFWMMEHGLLSPERAKRAYERKQKSKQQIKMGTPQITNRAENSLKQQASKNGDMHVKKRIISGSEDGDDNFIVKRKKGTRTAYHLDHILPFPEEASAFTLCSYLCKYIHSSGETPAAASLQLFLLDIHSQRELKTERVLDPCSFELFRSHHRMYITCGGDSPAVTMEGHKYS